MSNATILLVLAVAALLEAGGDGLVRAGMHAQGSVRRVALVVLGAAVLTSYGLVVNAPPWDFGRLLGTYVALFFLTGQAINLVAFHIAPSPPVLAGGGLIVAGSLLITFGR